MKLLILFILISVFIECKDFKSTSLIKESKAENKQKNENNSFVNKSLIEEMMWIDNPLNPKKRNTGISLLTDTTSYKDTFIIKLCYMKDDKFQIEYRDTVAYFANYIANNNKWRILVYEGHKRNQSLEKFVIDYLCKFFIPTSEFYKFLFLDYFYYKDCYYVKCYAVTGKKIAFLECIYIIKDNKLLYLNPMPSLGMRNSFMTPDEYFEFDLNFIL